MNRVVSSACLLALTVMAGVASAQNVHVDYVDAATWPYDESPAQMAERGCDVPAYFWEGHWYKFNNGCGEKDAACSTKKFWQVWNGHAWVKWVAPATAKPTVRTNTPCVNGACRRR